MQIKAFILSIITMILTAVPAAAAVPVTAKIPVSCQSGETSAEYTYRIEASEKDAPMPGQGMLTLRNGQKGEFEITYEIPGSWHYQILQTNPAADQNDEASRPYTAAVFVGSKEDGSLFAECSYYRTGSTFKATECAFRYEADTKTAVVEKIDVGNNKRLLPGATLQLLDAEGNEIMRWISDNSAKQLTGLKPDTEYKIHELITPAGYENEPNGDLTFLVDKNGTVLITNNTGEKKADGTIQVLNGPKGVDWEEKYPERYKGVLGANNERNKNDKKKGRKGAGRGSETEAGGLLMAVRTGDDTPLLPWMLVLAASFVSIAIVLLRIRNMRKYGRK